MRNSILLITVGAVLILGTTDPLWAQAPPAATPPRPTNAPNASGVLASPVVFEWKSGHLTSTDVHSLTRAIVKGEEAAFEEFYERFSGRLYGMLLFLTSGREEVAREILQVTIIKAARKVRVFDHEEALWAWLSQVARNALVDYVRELARRPNAVSIDVLTLALAEPSAAEEDLLEWLEHGLNELDEEERALVESVYFQFRRQQDLADESGSTRKAIESKLARIRAKLRHFILQRIKNEQ